MSSAFHSVANNVQTTLAAPYVRGSGVMALAPDFGAVLAARIAAAGFPAIGADAPLKYTLIARGALSATGQILDVTRLAIFSATGLAGDELTGVSIAEGTVDQPFAAGDTFAVLWTAGDVAELVAAIKALQDGMTALDSTVVHLAGTEVISGAKTFTIAPRLASLTGLLKAALGILAQAIAGTDFVAPAGVDGGQTINGGTGASQTLAVNSTSHSTKGTITFNGLVTIGADGTFTITPANKTFAMGTGGIINFGSNGARIYNTGGLTIDLPNGGQLNFTGRPTDGATAVAIILGCTDVLSNATAKIVSFRNGTIEKCFIRQDGSIGLPTLADSAAQNNSLYFSSTTSKLTYKDSTGTPHAI